MSEFNKQTKLLSTTKEDIKTAAKIIKNGGLVCLPTETVYGLGANALNGEAVLNIFKAKGRANDNPLIVHIAKFDDIKPLVKSVSEKAKILAQKFWPGPLTMIFEKSSLIPDEVTCKMDTVAIRMPSHKVARAIIEESGLPIAAPSANISGGVSPVTAEHCYADLKGRVDAVVDGGECEVGLESTVILMVGDKPRLLRPGFVTAEQISEQIGEIIIDADDEKYYSYVNQSQGENVFALCYDEDVEHINKKCLTLGKHFDNESAANRLFYNLHQFDLMGAKVVFARLPKTDGVGLAVVNRLLRSAGFEVIKL